MISIKKTKKAKKGGRRGRPKTSTRLRVEDCAKVCVQEGFFTGPLPMFGSREASLTVTWPDGTKQLVTLKGTVTKQRLGGKRWWFRCPKCDGRVRCVYSPAKGQPFRCRNCWKLVYRSQSEPNALPNLLVQAQKLIRRRRRPGTLTTTREARLLRRLHGDAWTEAFLRCERRFWLEKKLGLYDDPVEAPSANANEGGDV